VLTDFLSGCIAVISTCCGAAVDALDGGGAACGACGAKRVRPLPSTATRQAAAEREAKMARPDPASCAVTELLAASAPMPAGGSGVGAWRPSGGGNSLCVAAQIATRSTTF